MAKTPKPDLQSPKKNVPAPEDPNKIKPGDDNFIGFDDDFKKYYIGKSSWIYHIGGFNTTDRATKLMKEYDDVIMNIQNTGAEVAEILEKESKKEGSTTDEQKEFVNQQQQNLSDWGNKIIQLKKEIILFCTEKCLKELDGKPFDNSHLDDDSIPLSRWWTAAKDIVSFLLVGDTKVEVTPSTMQ